MTDDQIKHMTSRFLQWRLPASFNPDCGISYTAPNHPAYQDGTMGPMGTNLFDAAQAEAMVRFMTEGLPVAYPYSEEMCPGHVASEGDSMICGRCGIHVRSLAPDDEPTP